LEPHKGVDGAKPGVKRANIPGKVKIKKEKRKKVIAKKIRGNRSRAE